MDLRAETGSTNADVASAARAGEPEGLVVVAERQVAGRGRQGRIWASPARAGLIVSVLLRPGQGKGESAVPAELFAWLPMLAGVALVESVRRLAAVEAVLKWPNDLLVGGRKCAGILAEVVPEPEPAAVVVGIGLNVTLREDELPPASAGQRATSLALAGAAATDRDPLLRAVLRSLAVWYRRWRQAGGDPDRSGLAAAYARHCGTLGRRMVVLLPDGTELGGTAHKLDAEGRLVVTTEAGEQRVVAAGDVRHLR